MGPRAHDSPPAHRVARDAADRQDRALVRARAQRERLHSLAVGLRSVSTARCHSIVVVAQRAHVSHTRLVSSSLQGALGLAKDPKTILEFPGRQRTQSIRLAA